MKKPLALTASALFVLVGAAYPDSPQLAYADAGMSMDAGSDAKPARYRACRPGPGDDRCIQLYERGVRASYARWLRDAPAESRVAVGGPYEPRARQHRRERHAHAAHPVRPERCVEPHPDGAAVRGM